MFTKAPPATPFAQRWSVWAAGFGGSQRTDGNAVLGSNDTRSSIYGTAVGADYRLLAEHAGRFCAGRRRHQFQRQQSRLRPLRPVPGRRVRPPQHRPGLYHRRAGLWLAGHHHRPHRDGRRLRSSPRRVQRQCLERARRGRLSLRRADRRRRRHHALCRRPVRHLRSAGLHGAGDRRRQHFRARLQRQERHRWPQRTRHPHRQVLRDVERHLHVARPARLGARLRSRPQHPCDLPDACRAQALS